MKITLLGTGHGTAINCYNTCFTLDDGKEYFLVDTGGGNGILKQLADSNIDVKDIKNIFVSHTHTDHIMGSIWMIRFIGRKYINENIDGIFNIYGNDEVITAIRKICNAVLPSKFTDLIDDKIKLIQVDTGDSAVILNKKVYFFDINARKVKQTGFSLWLNENDKFTFIGDEVCQTTTEKYVENSKWLFADTFMAGNEAEVYDPIKRHAHSTVKFVAELCERLNVKNVIMSHTIDTHLDTRKKEFTEDAKKYFNGNVYVPDDLEVIELD
ncbi:MAG: MBL fold metallo-hydrolase [Clostridia bacterium]|nr:MBL fold metallo-hydrolase [Clostridia bacterium]